MAEEFKIPGLKEAITEVTKLTEVTDKLAKDLLTTAINADKTMSAFKGNSGLKEFVETSKKATEENGKLEAAKKRLQQAESDQAKEIAKVNLQISEQISKNKVLAAAENENATALQKYNAKILEATKASKELGAQMALMALEGKKNTAEYKELEKAFLDASKTSKLLNDNYREISKTAGDNRALVGSYSDELKGHFDMINGSIMSLKGNIASGNFSGAFSDARTVVKGFGEALKKTTTTAKEMGTEMKTGGGAFNLLKTKATEAGESIQKAGQKTLGFFKPSEEHSAKMSEGLDRIMIGFKRNTVAIEETTVAQTEANVVGEVANETAKKGTIFTELWAGAQLMFSAATGIATGAVITLGLALSAIGIGLIIAAVALLADGLSKFRPLMNFLKDGLAGVGAVVEMLSDKITAFVVNIKSVGDLMGKLADIMAHPIDSIKKIGSEMVETAKRGAELNEQTRKLTASQKDYAIESKNVENQIRTLMLQAKNRTTSEAERIELLKKAQSLEESMHTKKLGMWQQEMDLSLQKLKNEGKITDAEIELLRKGDQAALDSLKKKKMISSGEIEAFRDIMTKKADIDGEGIAVREKSNNMMDQLAEKQDKKNQDAEKKREEAAKKALEDQKKSMEFLISTKKLVLDNQIVSYKQEENLEDANLAHIRVVSLEKQAIANLEMQKNKIGIKDKKDLMLIEQKGSEEIVKIKQEESVALQKLALDNSKFELELYDLNNKTLIEEGKTLTDLLVNEEKKRIEKSLEVHRNGLREDLGIDKKFSDEKLKEMSKTTGLLTATQLKYLQGLEKLEESKNKDIKKLDADLQASKLKDINTELKNEQNKYKLLDKGAIANSKNDLKLKNEALKKELELEKTTAERRKEIQLEVALNQQELNKIVADNKKKILNDSLNNVIEVFGKESEVGKAAAIAQVTIDTYKSATSAYAGMVEAFPGPWGIAAGIAAAGLSIATGLQNVSKIAGIQMFEVGTMDAPYTGKAIVDEAGAEIHTDAHGNIKSMGESTGARITDIVKGDKIIPADISAIIKSTMFSGALFQYEGKKDIIDYAEMGKYFDKSASKIVAAVNKNGKNQLTVNVQRNIMDKVTFKSKRV